MTKQRTDHDSRWHCHQCNNPIKIIGELKASFVGGVVIYEKLYAEYKFDEGGPTCEHCQRKIDYVLIQAKPGGNLEKWIMDNGEVQRE